MAARQSAMPKSQDPLPFSERLLRWYDSVDRRQLPWQKNKTPYRVWVSEIMLQQTQAGKVVDYFKAFIRRFPSLKRLASAEIAEVLEQWAGLGYYRRAHQRFAGQKDRLQWAGLGYYQRAHQRFAGQKDRLRWAELGYCRRAHRLKAGSRSR